jgi:hypothetical protein
MRKFIRARMRIQAEKTTGKTIKVFRGLWKRMLKKNGKSLAIRDHRKKPTKKYAW